MDSKNVIAAIALSSAVIVLYSLFFIPEQNPKNQNLVEKEKIESNTDTPSLEQKETVVVISRGIGSSKFKETLLKWIPISKSACFVNKMVNVNHHLQELVAHLSHL